MKLIEFLGDSRKRIQAFPEGVRADLGRQLMRVQFGTEPADWKPMATVGPGVREIRVRDETGAYRVIYVANVDDRIYVLHAFKKTTQKTSQQDLNVANARFKSIGRN